ncbi:MAG: N-terminal glutamine amidohydrolase [Trebouxia sp. A1-2]|nr:MAG: N-terminal glutamine amidohydrolase [Trebouxia sp. A1-2]
MPSSVRAYVMDLVTHVTCRTLPFPCTLLAYADTALNAQLVLDTEFARLFRVVSGNDYLRGFASDRSHMRLSDGAWQAVPPTYPCITAPGRFNKL